MSVTAFRGRLLRILDGSVFETKVLALLQILVVCNVLPCAVIDCHVLSYCGIYQFYSILICNVL